LVDECLRLAWEAGLATAGIGNRSSLLSEGATVATQDNLLLLEDEGDVIAVLKKAESGPNRYVMYGTPSYTVGIDHRSRLVGLRVGWDGGKESEDRRRS
jgi:hypothetical protein